MITRQGMWCSFGLAVCLALTLAAAGCGEFAVSSSSHNRSGDTDSTPERVAQKPVADPAVEPTVGVPASIPAAPASTANAPTTPSATATSNNIPKTTASPGPEQEKATVGTSDVKAAASGAAASPAPNPASAMPRKVQLLVKEKSFTIDPGSGALRVPYEALDLLKVLNMEKVTEDAVSLMPPWLRELDGKEIIIRGFMRPQFSETGLTEFLLVPDIKYCCFGPTPAIYDVVEIRMAEGTTTDYIELRPFDVVGTFRIQMRFEDGFAQGLYSIHDARIIQK